MNYNQFLRLLISLMGLLAAIYFFWVAENTSKAPGFIGLLVLLVVNVYYYFFSNEWMKYRK